MIGVGLKLAVFWRALITAGLSQEPTVIGLYDYRSSQEPMVISLQHKKTAAVLSFLLSSIPRIETRVWALPSIVAAALHHEASA